MFGHIAVLFGHTAVLFRHAVVLLGHVTVLSRHTCHFGRTYSYCACQFRVNNICANLTSYLGTSPRTVNIPSMLSSMPSPLRPSLPISFRTPLSSWKWMPLTTPSLASCLSLALMERFVQSPTTPRPWLLQTPTIRNSLPSLRHSGTGTIALRAPPPLLMSSWTTKTLSISPPQKYSPAGKPGGLNFYLNLILSFVSAPENLVPSQTLSLDDGMSTPKRGIVAMPRLIPKILGQYSLKNSSLIPFALLT